MTNTNSDDIPKKLSDILMAASEKRTDMLDAVEFIKGPAYRRQLDGISKVANLFRTSNSLMCEKYPEDLRVAITKMQQIAIEELIEPFFMQQFPGTDLTAVKQRHEACEEFWKNFTVLMKQRRDAEKQLGGGTVDF